MKLKSLALGLGLKSSATYEQPRCRQTISFSWDIPLDIFGKENVRFYGGGVPDVFLDKGKATDAKLEQLLTWRSTP
jgi:hypothetical protein